MSLEAIKPELIDACLDEGYFTIQSASGQWEISPKIVAWLGLPAPLGALPLSTWQAYLAPSDWQKVAQTFQGLATAGKRADFVVDLQLATGRTAPFRVRALAKVAQGQSIWQGFMGPISEAASEQNKVSQLFKEYQTISKRFSHFIDTSLLVAFILEADGTYAYANHSYNAWMQVPGGIAGKNIRDIFPPQMAEGYLENVAEVLRLNAGVISYQPGHKVDGTPVTLLIHTFPIPQAEGAPQVGGICMDITDSYASTKEVEFERNEKTSLINSTDDWMWSFDQDKRYITGNEAFTRVVKNAIGQDLKPGDALLVQEVAKPEDYEAWAKRYERVLDGEAFTELVFEPYANSWLYLSFNPIFSDGAVVGGTCLTRNITELKKAQQDNEQLIDLLTQTNQELRQFAYMVSHDLRSPVRNLQALLQLLQNEPAAQQLSRDLTSAFVQTTHQLNDTLNNLVNQLVVKKQGPVSPDTVALKDVYERVVTSISQLVRETKAELSADFTAAPDVRFHGPYLESIFLNLLTNAIKYAKPDQAPQVTITSQKTADGAVQLVFADKGLGFDPAAVKGKIFGLGQRFHAHADSKGLGLYMVQQQLAALGGTITADGAEGVGAVFTITFSADLGDQG